MAKKFHISVRDHEHVSSCLPRNHPDYAKYGIDVVKSGPEQGKPIIRNLRDVRNAEEITGMKNERASADRSYGWDIGSRQPRPGS